MSNQVNHRVTPNKRNKRRKELPEIVSTCGGEGHNGAIGRSKWKKLSRRSERRAAGTKVPKIGKYRKNKLAKGRHRIETVKPKIDNDNETFYDLFEDGQRRGGF